MAMGLLTGFHLCLTWHEGQEISLIIIREPTLKEKKVERLFLAKALVPPHLASHLV